MGMSSANSESFQVVSTGTAKHGEQARDKTLILRDEIHVAGRRRKVSKLEASV